MPPLIREMQRYAAERESLAQGWLSDQPRWRALQRLVEQAVPDLAESVRVAVNDARLRAAELALEHSTVLIGAAATANGGQLLGMFNRVPVGALAEAIGALQLDSPLRRLAGMGETTSHLMGKALVDGISRGHHPTVIARQMRNATQMPVARALTISRTETLRAYRSSTLTAYRANSVVEGWVWYCSGGGRTCPACYAMSGTVHPLDEPMGSHPNCRCTALPKVIGASGVGGAYPEDGPDRFAALSDEDQRAVLGPGKYEAMQRGEIQLRDLVAVRTTREWGETRTVASLAQARAA